MSESKIAVFTAAKTPLELKNVAIPDPGEGELLVKIKYATICRSDLSTYSGKRREKTPTILGHEAVGQIVKFGAKGPQKDWRGRPLGTGDRITWAIYASDPGGQLAQQGIPQKGNDLFKYGHEELSKTSTLHGGFSQYILLRANTPVLKLAHEVPLPLAATINCAVSTIAGALRMAGNVEGKTVMISGAGMLGMFACTMCKTFGASQVIISDIDAHRRLLAANFGADTFLDARQPLAQQLENSSGNANCVDIIIECSGVNAAMMQSFAVAAIGATIVWVGAVFPQPDLTINAESVVRNLWTIKGLHNYNATDFINAVGFIEKHHNDFPFHDLIHDHFTLDTINEAFEYGLTKNPFRVGVKID